MDQSTRDIGKALIDLYSAFAASESVSDERVAFDTAMNRLREIEGVVATMDDSGDLSVDSTLILTASNVILMWALDRLTNKTGTSEEALLFDLRSFLERVN